MAKLIWNESGDLWKRIDSPTTFITGANLRKQPAEEKKPSVGWNNRVCENCGRPYTQPPPWSSFPDVENHPLWAEWQLTSYCNKGLCFGVQPSGECKPRIVETEPKK